MAEDDPRDWHPKLKRLHDYWHSKIEEGRLPGRADIDPLDIPDLLPSLILVDVVRGASGLRFRIRLVGTEYVEVAGQDLTGKWLDETHAPDQAREIAETYVAVVETGEPHYWRSSLHTTGREHINYERLICPLAADGETVDMLVGVFAFDRGG